MRSCLERLKRKFESDIDMSLSNCTIDADAFGKTTFADFASAGYKFECDRQCDRIQTRLVPLSGTNFDDPIGESPFGHFSSGCRKKTRHRKVKMRLFWINSRKYWLVILWLVLGFGAAGSLKGASVESWIRSDVHHAVPDLEEAGVRLPYMTGWFDWSKDQNLWYNFIYAGRWMAIGSILCLVGIGILTVCQKVYKKS